MLDAVGYAPFFVGNRCFLLEIGAFYWKQAF